MRHVTITPSREHFRARVRQGNVVPIYAELVADNETPVSAFQKLDDGGYSFLFESAEQNEQFGRFSFLGFDARVVLQSVGETFSITQSGRTRTFEPRGDPLAELETVMRTFQFVQSADLPRFAGGAVGYIGYDAIRSFEPSIPPAPRDPLGLPEMIFMIMGKLIIFDHRFRRVKLVVNCILEAATKSDAAYDGAVAELEHMLDRLSTPARLDLIDVQAPLGPQRIESDVTQQQFEAAVRVAKDHITAGDAFQIVLSQRFETDFAGDPLELYRCLRLVNPSPYMFCLKFGGSFALVGSSPELHARVTGDVVEVRPIAGTRRRGATPDEDARNAAELLADPKECAEHVMLIDLARNDVGRVADFGSVRVTQQMVVERYSHVMHLVSHVVGRLRADKTAFDVMRATFPAGTVSGAPKIRAMQIINELERAKRGCYAGAVGYFGFDGALDCCIALRSVVLKNGRAFVQAGAGIVADSEPAAEYRETVSKASAMMEAIARARRGAANGK
ncbi:MAG: anthranilate synthase component I [Chthoniobacterales bacterium]